jgi:predicted ABC-type transport system involved in lysophospholipase L1 biosynthesis ATPase subunit
MAFELVLDDSLQLVTLVGRAGTGKTLMALAAGLQRAGYHVSRDQPLKGYDRLYVDDPFGNRIELMEPKR